MKILKQSILLSCLAFLIACGGKTNPEETNSSENENAPIPTEKVDYSNMHEIDLSEYNVPAFIFIPNENKGKAKIEETAYGSVQIEVGERFGIEVLPFGLSLTEFKAELENDMVFQVEIIEETENYITYQKTIADSGTEAEFHFFFSKNLEGDLFEVKSMSEKEFSEGALKEMLKSAKSLSSKTQS